MPLKANRTTVYIEKWAIFLITVSTLCIILSFSASGLLFIAFIFLVIIIVIFLLTPLDSVEFWLEKPNIILKVHNSKIINIILSIFIFIYPIPYKLKELKLYYINVLILSVFLITISCFCYNIIANLFYSFRRCIIFIFKYFLL